MLSTSAWVKGKASKTLEWSSNHIVEEITCSNYVASVPVADFPHYSPSLQLGNLENLESGISIERSLCAMLLLSIIGINRCSFIGYLVIIPHRNLIHSCIMNFHFSIWNSLIHLGNFPLILM